MEANMSKRTMISVTGTDNQANMPIARQKGVTHETLSNSLLLSLNEMIRESRSIASVPLIGLRFYQQQRTSS
jgi:hypothetical protein